MKEVLLKAIHGDDNYAYAKYKRITVYNFSKKIRGLHYQEEPHQIKKFITCIKGEV